MTCLEDEENGNVLKFPGADFLPKKLMLKNDLNHGKTMVTMVIYALKFLLTLNVFLGTAPA